MSKYGKRPRERSNRGDELSELVILLNHEQLVSSSEYSSLLIYSFSLANQLLWFSTLAAQLKSLFYSKNMASPRTPCIAMAMSALCIAPFCIAIFIFGIERLILMAFRFMGLPVPLGIINCAAARCCCCICCCCCCWVGRVRGTSRLACCWTGG